MAKKTASKKSQPAHEREEFLALAFYYAMKAHESQFRKSTGRPYIEHPIRVAGILLELEAGPELIAAGFLHDVVEDTGGSIDDINQLFGPNVAHLVKNVSEDKTLSWLERKQHTIATLTKADADITLLSLADKLDNIRSIAKDYELSGEEIWARFVSPKDSQRWYYESLAAVFTRKLPKSPYTAEFARTVAAVFNK
jgi:(p)ppGpp synthase/HD superfamily hydrolase